MKYLALIYSNPASRAVWEGFSEADRAAALERYNVLKEEIIASGEIIVSGPLADVSLAKRVTVRDGEVMTTDGPFAEVKELLAGFFLLECESAERAVEIATKITEAGLGLVEVRPVLDRVPTDL
jgi:hypothetical protein